MYLLGISRDKDYSEGRVDADAAIFWSVCRLLGQQPGANVAILPENRFAAEGIPSGSVPDAVFHMTRSAAALDILETIEVKGIPVINSASAVRNCNRLCMDRMLHDAGVPVPRGIAADDLHLWSHYPCWLKSRRVAFAEDMAELQAMTGSMEPEDLNDSIVQEHVRGAVIKFYGVGERFWCRQITRVDQGKFGLELHNDLRPVEFDADAVSDIGRRAAEVAGLDVYGGDAVLTGYSDIQVIDLNDWPSFSWCADEAAPEIVKLILQRILHEKR